MKHKEKLPDINVEATVALLEEKLKKKVPEYVVEVLHLANDAVQIGRGRKPVNEKAMNGAERARKSWKKNRVENSKHPPTFEYTDAGHYDEFADALLLFQKGEDIEGMVPTYNKYLKVLYQTATKPRSYRRLKDQLHVNGIRLGRLLDLYGIFEKDEALTGKMYKATEKGKEFLCALYPHMRKVVEDNELAKYGEKKYLISAL